MLWKAVDVNANVCRMVVALEVLQLPLLPALPGALVEHTAALRRRRARGRPSSWRLRHCGVIGTASSVLATAPASLSRRLLAVFLVVLLLSRPAPSLAITDRVKGHRH